MNTRQNQKNGSSDENSLQQQQPIVVANEATSLLPAYGDSRDYQNRTGSGKKSCDEELSCHSIDVEDPPKHDGDELAIESGEPSAGSSPSRARTYTTRTSTRKGSSHWKKLKGHVKRGSFLLIPQSNASDVESGQTCQEPSQRSSSATVRSSLQGEDREQVIDELVQEIRQGMTFTVYQCLMSMIGFFLFSIVCYSFILEPKWTMLESCHFAVATVLTVGFGDYVPSSDVSRLFTCIYALVGVLFLGVVLGIIGSSIMDHHTRAKETSDAMKRYQVLSLFSPSPSFGQEQDIEAGSIPKKSILERSTSGLTSQRVSRSSFSSFFQSSKSPALPKQAIYYGPFLPLLFVTCFLGGSIGYVSDWCFVSTLYFMISSACSIGYGDLIPNGTFGILLEIFYLPLACGTMSFVLGIIAQSIMERRSAQFRAMYYTKRHKELTSRDLMAMDVNGDGKVSRAEFLEFMLLAMKKVDTDLIQELQEYFDRLDVLGSGELSKDDLIALARRKLASPERKKELADYKRRLMEKAESQRQIQLEQHKNQQGRVGRRRSSVWDSLAGLARSSPALGYAESNNNNNTHQTQQTSLWDSIARITTREEVIREGDQFQDPSPPMVAHSKPSWFPSSSSNDHDDDEEKFSSPA